MKKENKLAFGLGAGLLAAFGAWTLAVCLIDVQPIGPDGSAVGFAALNGFLHRLTGVHWWLYALTDWLGLIPLAVAALFGLLGLCQLIRRKSLWKVDGSILVLGGFYAAVIAVFLLFEKCVVNYRPVLIEGVLEASYPSSTTLLTMCAMPTAALQLRSRIQNPGLRTALIAAIWLFTALMVLGRLISGVHWFSDIVGGALLSAGLVTLYRAAADV
jgi:undecaprenyl-diphosphatase